MQEEIKQSAGFVQVLVPRALDAAFDYAVPEGVELQIGSYVLVPFGRETIWGVVWSENAPEIDLKKIKPLKEVSVQPPMRDALRRLIIWMAGYTMTPLGNCLSLCMSVPKAIAPDERKRKAKDDVGAELVIADSLVELSQEQSDAAERLSGQLGDGFSVTLLDGITGSGKTEVYLEAVEKAMRSKGQVLVLLPEIVLTAQFIARFTIRFGFEPVLWHSVQTPAKRRDAWRKIASGEAKLIVGARSALFLPYNDLRLIVVDEEHETAYKQEDGVVYHGRDMAVARARFEEIPVFLVSASPSVESIVNVQAGKYDVVHLSSRYGAAQLPEMHVTDMRLETLDAQHFLSDPLKIKMAETFERGEQSLLFLNRRGYAPLTLCRKCGYRFESPDASSWMVLHTPKYKAPYLQCHHTGFTMPMPEKCPECETEGSFAACGPGVERIAQEVVEFFPQAKVVVMASDTMSSPKVAAETYRQIHDGEVDIVVGTQMVAKGHHFPLLTLVGVVDADLGLDAGDLRAAEKTYQLIHQVSGRAGRAEKAGQALIQTYYPDSGIMKALKADDRDQFLMEEIDRRKKAHMPPYSRLAALVLSGKDDKMVRREAKRLASVAPKGEGYKVLGPAPAPMHMLRGNFRYRLLVIADRNINIQKLIKGWLAHYPLPSSIRCKIDIDPQSFM